MVGAPIGGVVRDDPVGQVKARFRVVQPFVRENRGIDLAATKIRDFEDLDEGGIGLLILWAWAYTRRSGEGKC